MSVPSGTIMIMSQLTDEHRAILDFERQWWKYAGAKESTIRDRFGITSVRYYQMLNWAIDQPEALVYDPMVVRRLQRLRTHRAAARSSSRLGAS